MKVPMQWYARLFLVSFESPAGMWHNPKKIDYGRLVKLLIVDIVFTIRGYCIHCRLSRRDVCVSVLRRQTQ